MFSSSCSCVELSGYIDPLQAQILVPIWGLQDISSSCLFIMGSGACFSSFYIHFVTIPQGLSLFNLVSLWGPFFKLEYQLQATETTPAMVRMGGGDYGNNDIGHSIWSLAPGSTSP